MENSFNTYLRELRGDMSLRVASEKIGISHSYLRILENGINPNTGEEAKTTPETLQKMASAYNVDYYELLIKSGIVSEDKIIDSHKKLDKALSVKDGEGHNIPLLRTICAGKSLLAKQNIEECIGYPFSWSHQPDYALQFKEDSMINISIEEGDIVYLKKASWAEYNGQIVAVIIKNEQNGTLKRMKWTEGSPAIQLISENEKYNLIDVFPNEIEICGVYMGHFNLGRELKERYYG